MSENYIVSVDQSTSATKACLFSATGEILRRVTIEHQSFYPRPGWVEQDPKEVLHNTRAAIETLVSESGVSPAKVVALSITNQRETILVWDGATGEPLYRALVWQDERGTEICRSLIANGSEDDIAARTGLVVDSYFSASKLQWMMENVPECKEAARAERLLAGTIDSWLIWNFTDRKTFATDYSNACRTLLFNIKTLRWDEALLNMFGLDSVRLPDVRYSDETFGTFRFASSGAEVPIIGVMGDSHAALYGQGGYSTGDAKTTFGTGSSVMMNIGPTFQRSPAGVVTSLAWGIGRRVTYVYEGNIHATGDTVRWVRDQIGLFKSYDEAENRAAALEDNGGVHLVPAFSGLGSPHWVHGVRAAIVGISRGTGADHIIRAALESIAYQVDDVIRAMTEDDSLRLPKLHVDGGATANRFLMQFLADIMGVPVRVAEIQEISARGVAFVAGIATGVWRDEQEIASLIRPAAEFAPRISVDQRRSLHAGWRKALEQVMAGANAHE
jgi:glycerol kinase